MNDLKVRRWAGAFGVAGFVVFLVALPLYFVGPQSAARLEDTVQFSDSVSRASTLILMRATLADPLIMVGFLVMLAGTYQDGVLIEAEVRAQFPLEWIQHTLFSDYTIPVT